MGVVGAVGHRRVHVLVFYVSPYAVVSGAVSAVPVDGRLFLRTHLLAGRFSEWLGELVIQFYYVEWMGALLLALLFVAFTTRRLASHGRRALSAEFFVPSVLLLWLLGDPSVLLGYVWALLIAVGAYALNKGRGRKSLMADVLIVPLVYWLAGPLAWVYVLQRLLGGGHGGFRG